MGYSYLKDKPLFIVSHLSHLASKVRHRYNDIMGLERYAQGDWIRTASKSDTQINNQWKFF